MKNLLAHMTVTMHKHLRLAKLSLALLSVLILFAQSAELVHSHDGDLKPQFDCEMCLKLGSGGDAIVVSYDIAPIIQVDHFDCPADVTAASVTFQRPRARSPPHLS